jgi:DNA-directed RNA polymerase subunit RPC12/RpoP
METVVDKKHNPYFTCPKCSGDNVGLCPPSFGEKSFYVCMDCSKVIEPIKKDSPDADTNKKL